MVEKAAPDKKKAPEVEKTVIEEEDLFEDFAVEDGRFGYRCLSINYTVLLNSAEVFLLTQSMTLVYKHMHL